MSIVRWEGVRFALIDASLDAANICTDDYLIVFAWILSLVNGILVHLCTQVTPLFPTSC
jgi:hypothetical protein